MQRFHSIRLASLFTLMLTATVASNPVQAEIHDNKSLHPVIQQAQLKLMSMKTFTEGSYWNMPSNLGEFYVAQYYLSLRWLSADTSFFDTAKLRSIILSKQLPDGGWTAVKDANNMKSEVDATLFNYWYLKVIGNQTDKQTLMKAKDFLLKQGGLEKASLFSKIFLALFDQYTWSIVPNIPLWLFETTSLVHEEKLGQWIGPHLLPISYLKNHRVSKNMGEAFDLSELFLEKPSVKKTRIRALERQKHLKLILSRQRPLGSWGGYTLATLLNLKALSHYSHHYKLPREFASADSPFDAQSITQAFERGSAYLKKTYTAPGFASSYMGTTCDGRYWDSALVSLALLESGVSPARLQGTAQYLVRTQNSNGGFGFGHDFEMDPDTDDTSMIVRLLGHVGGHDASAEKATQWLVSLQNKDGGWGAFAKNNNENALIQSIGAKFLDSADLFDESSSDITAHVLEALGERGLNVSNSKAVKRAVDYLLEHKDTRAKQRETHPHPYLWRGRWGVNYIYGTSAVVNSLVKVGVSAQHPSMSKAAEWLLSVQNSDGGFGETTQSDRDPSLAGKGISTASQTAWALMALLDLLPPEHPSVQKAVGFLLRTFDKDTLWTDISAVGTGHPALIYMVYPSYAKAFPLMALGKYRSRISP